MKGYKFKLDAVRKIRKLKEDQCKMEIGRLQVQINEHKSSIEGHNQGIQEAFESQEIALEKGLSGQELRFHPFFVSGKRAHIDKIQTEILRLTDEVNDKFEDLKRLRADSKLIEDMKEKDQIKYKKALQKKQFEEMEEQVQNWKISMKG